MSNKVSVIIAAYNAGVYMAQTLHSVNNQTLPPAEIIFIDDGSIDNTAEIVQTFPAVHYVFQENQGAAAARNKGLELAAGSLIAFLDADDTWPDGKLARQAAFLKQQPETDCAGGLTQLIDAQGAWIGAPMLTFQLGSILFRRAVLQKVGSFDESLLQGEDMDLVLRVRESGEFRLEIIPEVVLYYRRHTTNLTRDASQTREYFIKALKRSVDRRRSGDGSVQPLPEIDLPESLLAKLDLDL